MHPQPEGGNSGRTTSPHSYILGPQDLHKLWVLVEGVLVMGAPLFGFHIRVPGFWKAPGKGVFRELQSSSCISSIGSQKMT